MIKIKEAILVEGRYDVNKIKQIFDTIVIETSGFGIFSDKNKISMIQTLAERRGLILLTDSDGAGLVIRNYVHKFVPKSQLKNAYIPEIHGKEKRKRAPGKEYLLGVEGVSNEIIVQALRNAGATFLDEAQDQILEKRISKLTFFELGLSGAPDSGERRKKLLQALQLPHNLSANALIDYCNCVFSEEEFTEHVKKLFS